MRFDAARAASEWPSLAVCVAVAGCDTTANSIGKRIDYKSESTRAGARDTARPDDARSTTTATTCRPPRASPRRDATRPRPATRSPSTRSATPDRAGGNERWLVVKCDAGGSVEHDAQVLDGQRLRARRSSSRARHHGDRLGGEPRRTAAHRSRSTIGKVADRLLHTLQARQVPHAHRARHRARHGRHLHLAPR